MGELGLWRHGWALRRTDIVGDIGEDGGYIGDVLLDIKYRSRGVDANDKLVDTPYLLASRMDTTFPESEKRAAALRCSYKHSGLLN